jgi:hypothetical protein
MDKEQTWDRRKRRKQREYKLECKNNLDGYASIGSSMKLNSEGTVAKRTQQWYDGFEQGNNRQMQLVYESQS